MQNLNTKVIEKPLDLRREGQDNSAISEKVGEKKVFSSFKALEQNSSLFIASLM